MDTKKILISLVPVAIFSLAILFLWYFVGFEKMVTFQGDTINHFFSQIRVNDLSTSIVSTLSFVWWDCVFNLLIFVIIISIGYLTVLVLQEHISLAAFSVLMLSASVLLFLLTSLSIFVFLICIGLGLSVFWIDRTFEIDSRGFITGIRFVGRGLKIVTIFLAVGFLVSLLMNLDTYGPLINTSNEQLFDEITPDNIKDAQKREIDTLVDGIKDSLTEQYDTMHSSTRRDCGSMYTGLVTGLENFRMDSHKQIDEASIDEILPPSVDTTFDVFNKMQPLFLFFGLFIVMGILNSVGSLFSGVVYFVVGKLIYSSEQSSTSSPVSE